MSKIRPDSCFIDYYCQAVVKIGARRISFQKALDSPLEMDPVQP